MTTGFTFEGSNDVFRDPTTIEPAKLCLNAFLIDVTAIHQVRIERNMIFNPGECGSRPVVCPSRVLGREVIDHDVEVTGHSLPLAEGCAIGRQQDAIFNCIRR